MKDGGSRTWYFADGYLPEKSNVGRVEAHEALMLLNVAQKDANVSLDFFFDDREPVRNVGVIVKAERIIALRMDRPDEIGGVVLEPLQQYAVRVCSDVNIIAQFGRVDTTQPNMSYYSPMGYHED